MKSYLISLVVETGHRDTVFAKVRELLDHGAKISRIYKLGGSCTYDVLVVTQPVTANNLSHILDAIARIDHCHAVDREILEEDRAEYQDKLYPYYP